MFPLGMMWLGFQLQDATKASTNWHTKICKANLGPNRNQMLQWIIHQIYKSMEKYNYECLAAWKSECQRSTGSCRSHFPIMLILRLVGQQRWVAYLLRVKSDVNTRLTAGHVVPTPTLKITVNIGQHPRMMINLVQANVKRTLVEHCLTGVLPAARVGSL